MNGIELKMAVKGHHHRIEDGKALILLDSGFFGEVRFKAEVAKYPIGATVTVLIGEPNP